MRSLVAGNWKMNGLAASLVELGALKDGLAATVPSCDVLVCPPATLIAQANWLVKGAFALGGQDCHAQASGAFTGDLSAEMLKDAGASHVIVGHSERRQYHGESDADVAAKVKAAWRAGLKPGRDRSAARIGVAQSHLRHPARRQRAGWRDRRDHRHRL
jgi:triosephosphate isomerase